MATALVTGGTSGIGAAFARALAARGDDLILVARDAERLSAMAADLTQRFGVAVETMAADLADRDDTERVAARLRSTDAPVDLLVNNAGFGIHTKLLAVDTSRHELGLKVMCRAVLVLCAAAGRAMSERGKGAIINVSSTAGYVTMGSYSATKAWVTAYTEALSIELAGTGVSVTALCPGWVRTEFHQRAGIRTSAIPGPMWLDADKVVQQALVDAEKGKVISIPSARYQGLVFLLRHVPRRLVRGVSARMSSSRHHK
ncbi:MAG TPA: SDR family oxidoreductase [Propionibacteriaceae bacterium]|nr:SDR family oxidoreductase [Propionibacteriaceae bacterium]